MTLFTVIKIFSALISIGFLFGIFYSWYSHSEVSRARAAKYQEHFSLGKAEEKSSPNFDRWQRVAGLFQSPDSNGWRLAIIDADTMMEDMITSLGYMGDTFGEKLKSMSQAGVPWLQAAWDVHLLRNKIAHEGDRYHLSDREAYRAFKIYESIFYETGYLA